MSAGYPWSLEQTPDPDAVTGTPPDLQLLAHIEGLVGEEERLLAIPGEERTKEHRDRLHAIATELDRIWDKLRERGERRAPQRPPAEPAS